MVNCELCGGWFHIDDIKKCPKCDLELCEECFDKHVTTCLLGEFNDLNEDDESTIPRICPNCGESLELDQDPDGSMRVYCENCDFVQELSEEQKAEFEQDKSEEDGDLEQE